MLPFFPVLQPLSGSLSLASRKSVFSPSPGFFQYEYGDLLIVMRVMGVPGKSVTETIVTLSGLSVWGSICFWLQRKVAECSSSTAVNYQMMLSIHPVVGSCSQFSVCVGLEFTQWGVMTTSDCHWWWWWWSGTHMVMTALILVVFDLVWPEHTQLMSAFLTDHPGVSSLQLHCYLASMQNLWSKCW